MPDEVKRNSFTYRPLKFQGILSDFFKNFNDELRRTVTVPVHCKKRQPNDFTRSKSILKLHFFISG
jgi:hypothetical protein